MSMRARGVRARLVRPQAAADHPAASIGCKVLVAGVALAVLTAGPAHAERVGEFAGSGFLFKDNIEVIALDDPGVSGVTIYLSDFKRSIVDKLKKDFFTEPSQTSLSCAITGPVTFNASKISGGGEGQEVFTESKGLNFFQNKTLRVRRLYDSKRNTLLYVAYSTRLTSDEGSVSTGRSADVPGDSALPWGAAAAAAAAAAAWAPPPAPAGGVCWGAEEVDGWDACWLRDRVTRCDGGASSSAQASSPPAPLRGVLLPLD
ncbi:hypothetical protein FOA52_010964 [Chlamydomonas sp. UWO 241]|nr:hypothetical protein FOA52_010964 [Chlamydomonas sp. UWO 241]